MSLPLEGIAGKRDVHISSVFVSLIECVKSNMFFHATNIKTPAKKPTRIIVFQLDLITLPLFFFAEIMVCFMNYRLSFCHVGTVTTKKPNDRTEHLLSFMILGCSIETSFVQDIKELYLYAILYCL